MEPKVFYGLRKTRVATIAKVHDAIESARNAVNIFLLPPNSGESGNQKSDTKEVSAESMEKIYELARELEIEEDLENDHKVKLPLRTRTKRGRQELLR